MVVIDVGRVVGGELAVLIVVGSEVSILPRGCVKAGGALMAGWKTLTKPEEHRKQLGEVQLHREVHTDVRCVGGVLLPR